MFLPLASVRRLIGVAIRTDDTDVKYQLAARMEAHILALIVAECITMECGIDNMVYFRLAVFKGEFANAIQAEAEMIDNHGVKMVPEVSREHWSQSTPASGDCRYPLEYRIKMIGDLPSKAVEKLGKDEELKIDLDALRPMTNKGAIDMHDKDCSADGALAEETDAKTKHFLPLDIIPCMAVKLPPDVIKLPRAVHACLLSPELLSVSVPAAPNISYQCSLPTIDGVKCVLTAGPIALACRYRPIVVGRLTRHVDYFPCQQLENTSLRAPRNPNGDI